MDLNSPIFDRIRTRRNTAAAQPNSVGQRCQHPGCQAAGEFRAPMGRLREGQYFCFCLDHVREYNATYNYFNGMSDDAVLLYQKEALTGHRPTWKMGSNHADSTDRRSPNAYGAKARRATATAPRHGVVVLKALHVLGLDDDARRDEIKARYKELVKRLHPDANGGDRSNEGRLREIINAYNVLRSFRAV
ncbi:J domain-containing protein [Rhodoblastus acidophilus]|uniref:J domain-containing protein n=2 Tax=Candidatus Rhodoblastus alkanivorans TaxID=2954117 RepID=A0ABS9Z2Z3_9HYPH|nr:DnaJ domain-containing protein [Candidatus Rhodoblastus alkanivorans]MCI4678117.1 J domain-containing protein [Candidatus Rhodoblastus alkanivorans]MCI4681542.1 J domain-containing protein [Candidatus Rhodoblastus alkanivorans]MDI4642590.1 J domain-containing protein [Rhodoblastus acidophilus]